jgi:hypothetical protein
VTKANTLRTTRNPNLGRCLQFALSKLWMARKALMGAHPSAAACWDIPGATVNTLSVGHYVHEVVGRMPA